jgi:anti-anti-sigma factor
MSLIIDIVKSDAGVYRVKLDGSLDSDTTPQFETRVESIWADPEARVISLELQDLKFISSLGLGAVAKVKKTITSRGGVMLTVGAQPQVAKVFQIVKMLPKEVVFASRQEADDYLAEIQNQVVNQQKPARPGS